jgi:hypothetical protein
MKRSWQCILFVWLLIVVTGGAKPVQVQAQTSALPEPGRQASGKSDILQPPPAEGTTQSAELVGLTYTLAVFYVLPADIPFDQAIYNRIREASLELQAWYQVATGGMTWEWAYPEIVRVYYGPNPRQYYLDNGNWWGSLLQEMDDAGLPIWEPGMVTGIWAQGAGWWAGAAQGCETECGVALLGVELFPEFDNPAWTEGKTCPDPDGQGGEAWPCTPLGAYIHELGHTLGLPHPIDVPLTEPYASHSIMQTHWNYPNQAPPEERPWGLLQNERQLIHANPFMKTGLPLVQIHQDAEVVVNLPVNGSPPLADFELEVTGCEIQVDDNTQGAVLHYWTFGDYAASSSISPAHAYAGSGTYKVILRASSALAAMSMESRMITVNCPYQIFLPIVIMQ